MQNMRFISQNALTSLNTVVHQGDARMIVETQIATVFKGGGRRFFTKRAAYRAAAKAKIRERCDCYPADPRTGDSGETCKYHEDLNRWDEIVGRLARLYQNFDQIMSSSPNTCEEKP